MPPVREISCAYVLASPGEAALPARRVRLDRNRIVAVDPASGPTEPVLAVPPFANAHDHARTVRSSSYGAAGKPLETWLFYLALPPPVDPYLVAAVSLSRSALGGSGAVMVHYTRIQGVTDFTTEVRAVARAASDVGVRIGFAVALRDRNPLVYGPSEPILSQLPPFARAEIETRLIRAPMPVKEQIALVDGVAEAVHGPMVDVQYGPNGVQWATRELLQAVAEASARTGRRVHMHMLETRYQRAWADKEYPGGIVKYLDEIGLLSPRLTLAHCTWARPDELDLLGERGVTISANTSSNLGIRSGIAPVAEMLRRGCRVGLGLDGLAFDEDDDGLREMRLAHLLHGGTGFRVDVSRADILTMAFKAGRQSVLNTEEGGVVAVGQPADLLLLDWDALDDDRLREDIDPLSLLLARVTARHVREMIVDGRSVVLRGRVLGVDYPALRQELLVQLRSAMASDPTFANALSSMEPIIARHFEGSAPCC